MTLALFTCQTATGLPKGIYAIELGNKIQKRIPGFDQIIGNQKIVALGEDVHTSEGFYQVKAQLIKYLISKKGYRGILFEDTRFSGAAINDYLTSGSNDAYSVIQKLYPVWHSQSILEMIEWVRQYNIENPKDMVVFFGIDIQQTNEDLQEAQHVLAKYKDGQSAQLQRELLVCEKVSNFNKMGAQKEYEQCKKALNQTSTYFSNKIDQNSIGLTLASLKAGITLHYTMANFEKIGQAAYRESMNGRDKMMATIILNILEKNKNKKFILWAHNSHITYNKNMDYSPMGIRLKKSLKKQYVPIALTANKAETNWATKLPRTCTDYTHEKNTVQNYLLQFDKKILFVDKTSALFSVADHKHFQFQQCFSGDLKNDFIWYKLRESFDALLYLDKSEPMILFQKN